MDHGIGSLGCPRPCGRAWCIGAHQRHGAYPRPDGTRARPWGRAHPLHGAYPRLDGAGLDPVVVPTCSMVRILDSTVPGSPMWSVPVHRCPLSAWCASSTRRCPSSTLWSGPGGSPARMDRCPPASWCAASTRRYRARPCGRCPPSAWCASSTRRCPSSTLWSVPGWIVAHQRHGAHPRPDGTRARPWGRAHLLHGAYPRRWLGAHQRHGAQPRRYPSSTLWSVPGWIGAHRRHGAHPRPDGAGLAHVVGACASVPTIGVVRILDRTRARPSGRCPDGSVSTNGMVRSLDRARARPCSRCPGGSVPAPPSPPRELWRISTQRRNRHPPPPARWARTPAAGNPYRLGVERNLLGTPRLKSLVRVAPFPSEVCRFPSLHSVHVCTSPPVASLRECPCVCACGGESHNIFAHITTLEPLFLLGMS